MARLLDVEKRERILTAAREAFGTHGFARTTIKLIAGEAGLAQGTVYTYFESKEKLFQAVTGEILDVFTEGVNRITNSNSNRYEQFNEFLEFGFSLLRQVHPLLRGMYSDVNRRELLHEKLDLICGLVDDLFHSSEPSLQLFGDVSRETRRFNLRMIVYGVLFQTSLARPEDLDKEISGIKKGVLKGLRERILSAGSGG